MDSGDYADTGSPDTLAEGEFSAFVDTYQQVLGRRMAGNKPGLDAWWQDAASEGEQGRPPHLPVRKPALAGLPPGRTAWQSRRNPWHWPRRGGLPPMEETVSTLLEGQPPPLEGAPTRRPLQLPRVQKPPQGPPSVPDHVMSFGGNAASETLSTE